jgi:hypothetical protein
MLPVVAPRLVATIVRMSGPFGNPGADVLPFPERIDVPRSLTFERSKFVTERLSPPEFSV